MVTLHDLPDESSNLELIEDFLLGVLRVDDLVKLEVLAH